MILQCICSEPSKMQMIRGKTSVSESDIIPYKSQVAGHACGERASGQKIMKHRDGFILKPMKKSPEGLQEVQFYENLSCSSYSQLQNFVPKFFGTTYIESGAFRGPFLMLEDIVQDFIKPCIMDVKMGRQTWDPFASQAKIESEMLKYAECKKELAFCIPGFQVYDPLGEDVTKFGKEYGKKLNRKTAIQAIGLFLNMEKSKRCSSRVAKEFIIQLKNIEQCMRQLSSIHLYSSSILLAYDSSKMDSKELVQSWVRTKMIDFAHAIPLPHGDESTDDNYLAGLRNLILVLEELTLNEESFTCEK